MQESINNTFSHGGRFGNLFILAMVLHFIALKNDLAVAYKDHDKIKALGIDLFVGKNTYETTVPLEDDSFFSLIKREEPMYENVSIVNNVWCQTRPFAFYLYDYFHNQEDPKKRIIEHNRFKERYQSNQDVFVHIRLGDIYERGFSHPFEYYDRVLSSLSFEKGYISSDTIDHPLCQQLIERYSLEKIEYDEVETILFASTCRHLVLSTGTFSWMMGLFAFFSEVYYPEIKQGWHGDIFVFPQWKQIHY